MVYAEWYPTMCDRRALYSTPGRLVVSGWLIRGLSESDASGGLRYEKPRRK